jgi:hypothetical protein|uniref:ISAs1 family transposase n=1 Tax=Acidicaldus sp. TaxID=1872105 RepID=A0A8J4M514_9PROT
MVSAWGCAQPLVRGQIATAAKSSEITVVAKLPQLLSLEGCTVTVGALNCQRRIAQQVIDQKGDCVLALKATRPACMTMWAVSRRSGEPGRHRQAHGGWRSRPHRDPDCHGLHRHRWAAGVA